MSFTDASLVFITLTFREKWHNATGEKPGHKINNFKLKT